VHPLRQSHIAQARLRDPAIGPAADLRRRADREDEARGDRVDADPLVRDEVSARAADAGAPVAAATAAEPARSADDDVVIDDRVVGVGRTDDDRAAVEEHQVVTERPNR